MMPDEPSRGLEDILDAYDARLRAVEAEKQRARDEADAWDAALDRIVGIIIQPALTAAAEKLRRRGHRADVMVTTLDPRQDRERTGWPVVRMTVIPSALGQQALDLARTPSVEFVADRAARRLSPEARTAMPGYDGEHIHLPPMALEDVTRETVNHLIVACVGQILDTDRIA
ncbi:MAG: hypothetical protein HYX51_03785 [Chloroflexi bacterium]|nr:hypothetical protein [Chloroflexota bacterium]